jgi:hypothetical protein
MVLATLLCLALTCGARGAQDEVSLFDHKGRATAYINKDTDIYVWDGKPVAYLVKDNSSTFDIYGFNGKHLGWFTHGIIYDNEGNAVGGTKDAFSSSTELEPLKGLKRLKSLKDLQELRPLKPRFTLFRKTWSDVPLGVFLRKGVDPGWCVAPAGTGENVHPLR